MDTICACLKHEHQRCDELLNLAEAGMARGNWTNAIGNFRQFLHCLCQHIRMEETILLPTLEQTFPGGDEPAGMLRTEHRQIHAMAERMWEAVQRFDTVEYVLHAETLTLLMQQHTLKEEEMLYPLLDKALACKRHKVIDAMVHCLDCLELEHPAPVDG